jgi:hypothetical protein
MYCMKVSFCLEFALIIPRNRYCLCHKLSGKVVLYIVRCFEGMHFSRLETSAIHLVEVFFDLNISQ